MSTAALTLRVLLAVVLGWSSVSKLTPSGRRGLSDMLTQLGIGRQAGWVGGLLIVGEATSAVLLLLPWTVVVGAGLATVLMAVLTAGTVLILRRRLKVTCACFGSSSTTIAPIHAVRNGLLLLGAAVAASLGPDVPADLVTAAVAVAVGAVLAIVMTRLDDFAFLLSPR
ncbi:MauE/DoxX family redox-associated membrane protein [Fodinicola feengrottensis]|uniref:Methylamine utilisation protein MauE domain-containing protein n=1 Tax=Fodinicola feengrottensis TaxID=435914 RepID=A0ABN2HTN4_9ACTN|nr:MauE/DoxX family redox-associated membrane protein [Fodinicola feengrottensis]